MFCRNCGATLLENAFFCKECGTKNPFASSEDAEPFFNNEEHDDCEFVVSNDTLISYNGNSPCVVIPDNIRIIGKGAFVSNLDITDITIPENVEQICEMAFLNVLI
ncbi:MAG: leucine-rich repeat protein [Clostridia bacterium]|nr:leucine-rich repeat protein [Clostridia bacterium]